MSSPSSWTARSRPKSLDWSLMAKVGTRQVLDQEVVSQLTRRLPLCAAAISLFPTSLRAGMLRTSARRGDLLPRSLDPGPPNYARPRQTASHDDMGKPVLGMGSHATILCHHGH